MAAAAPSPLASSVGKTNGAKLSRLLIDGGSTVLRRIFDSHHPPANLSADLNANYHTLNNLLRRRVLHKPQWDLLFPPCGATPDSNTFDITLLFLLLTNICGLSPPPSGWHTKPPLSDTSVEANLARIKFFRNKLYGHVTSTGINTPTFSALWLEISAVLVALGFPQAEIDRLKAEHCGEEDFIDVLFEWADSEEDIKSQLKDIRRYQSKARQAVDEVHLTQLEDRKILQDCKRKLEELHEVQTQAQQTVDEVRQSQTKTQQTVDEVRQSQTKTQQTVDEVRQSQTKTQQTVDEVRQSQTKTQQTVDEVRQSQTKTQQTVDEVRQCQTKTQQTVDEVRQSQIKTQQAVDEVRQNQLEDRKIFQDNEGKLDDVQQFQNEVRQTQFQTHHIVSEARETQLEDSIVILETRTKVEEVSERLETLQQQYRQRLEDLESGSAKHRQDEILKKLAKIDALKDSRHHADRYVEGTRVSIFKNVLSWLDDRTSRNRVMVISGNAGMGKSVISAVMCEKMQEAGRLAGSHFCHYDRARHRNPKVMLQSLASQLCDSLPDYKNALVGKLSRNLGVEINNMEVKDLFEVLFEEPLTSLNDPGLTYLMVIDGLDESEFQGRNELLDVIARFFNKLPSWIKFLVTSRPEINIRKSLKCLQPLELEPDNEDNMVDIRLFFDKQLGHVLQTENQESILQALIQKSEGVMLYAHFLVDFIKKNVPLLTPEQLASTLPSGISSVYHSYFNRLETDLCKELKVTEPNFLKFLSAVAVAREPLPLGFVAKLLLPGRSTSLVQRKVNAAIACVSALLPVQDECVHFFHKSVKDWFIERSNYGQHHFSVEETEGHHVLSQLCIDELDEVKQKGIAGTQFSDTTKYALRHGVQHILQLEEDARIGSLQLEEVVKKYILDLELLYAKLCVSGTASEDILCLQNHEGAKSIFEECHKALGTLLHLLRKHLSTLTKLPHTIFQTLLNEGGPELSSQALNLLETKYSEMAYMEYLHKEDLQGLVQTKFHCSAAVACFDVSPQLDYMVCECDDDTIQLWSLYTGKQLWKRDVQVKKYNYFESDEDYDYYEPYRPTTTIFLEYEDDDDYLELARSVSKSFYRSVVFHPTEDLVLPGILSHAYTLDGDLKPLFLSSRCCFSVCSISADKSKILTNCPNNGDLVIMWSLTDGSEINRYEWNDYILSFAWSHDGSVLAISDCSGSIVLVDPMDSYRTLAQTTTLEVCGGIKFSPDCRSLYCLHFDTGSCSLFRLDTNMESDCTFSLVVSLQFEDSYHPWEFESCNEAGYLLGDPFCLLSKRGSFVPRPAPTLALVLNTESVLKVGPCSSVIEMLYLDELRKDSAGVSNTAVKEVVFSLSGDTLYVVTTTRRDQNRTVMAWDISSGIFKPGKRVFEGTGWFDEYILVAVREGVLLQTSRDTLELWNFELSQCIRSWTDLEYITEVIPISEERVACEVNIACEALCGEVETKVIILDTTREGIISTINIHGKFVACNRKCQVITVDKDELQMKCGDVVLWKISLPFYVSLGHRSWTSCKAFSPSGQYCVLAGRPKVFNEYGAALYVLDAVSGKILHKLWSCDYSFLDNVNVKFVSDQECVTNFCDELRVCLRLFNVKSGDLLSEIAMESEVYSLAACPRECLIATGFMDSKVNFKVLQVKLPRDKDNGKSKRIKPKE